jgi:hypothetical protein
MGRYRLERAFDEDRSEAHQGEARSIRGMPGDDFERRPLSRVGDVAAAGESQRVAGFRQADSQQNSPDAFRTLDIGLELLQAECSFCRYNVHHWANP